MSSLSWYYRETFLHSSSVDSKLAFNYLEGRLSGIKRENTRIRCSTAEVISDVPLNPE